MKHAQLFKGLFALLVVLTLCSPAAAAYSLYDKEGATFTVDGFFNTFYVHSSSDKNAAMEALIGPDRDQSRIKMGFLPNYIGFNFGKQVDDLKVGGRSSFWVTINDSDSTVTSTGIDVRQFYGTVDGSWGQILFGKDFTLFCRSNIFNDEILLGYGNVSDFNGLIDGNGVSFGDIGSGYVYPLPTAQITYRTPDFGGFKLAVGLVDPSRTSSNTAVGAEEEVPRLEGEATFNKTFG
jgi:predicted porin